MGNFDLSHQHKLSTDMGLLVPVCTQEVVAGDQFTHSTSMLMRVAPLANPVMHDVSVRLHHWYVPNRIVDDAFEDWIVGNDENPAPSITLAGGEALADHMGIPPVAGVTVDARPIRGYNLIYNEWYRDQHLQDPYDLDDLTLKRCAWEKDYLTSARPQPTTGDAIDIGFSSGRAPVLDDSNNAGGTATQVVKTPGEGTVILSGSNGADGGPSLFADLANMEGGININDLRRDLALQKFSEARAAFGSRYVDYLRYLGVRPSDGRLQRPEYLGGGSANINFSEVLATAEGASTSVGDMFGHGISGLRTRPYRRYFEEHGWLISLLSVRPKTVYMDRIPRQFTRFDAMDVYQRELEALPWQEVKGTEVHHGGDANTAWGYAPRYDDYRYSESYVSGSFRSGPEKDWHMAREFADPPTLNASFIECTPTDRIYQDTSMPELLVNMRHNIRSRRVISQQSALAGDSKVNLL